MRVAEADRHEARRRWLRTSAAADLLGVSPGHLRRLIEDGDLRALDVSRKGSKQREYRIREEDLNSFIERHTTSGTSAA